MFILTTSTITLWQWIPQQKGGLVPTGATLLNFKLACGDNLAFIEIFSVVHKVHLQKAYLSILTERETTVD